KRKTALLIATSCELGAVAAGASTKHANRLYRYGYHLGMSFQIIDDLLDFTASTQPLGQHPGRDLMQRNITLPIFLAMEDDTFKGTLDATFRTYDVIDETAIAPLLLKLHQSDAVDRSYQLSNRYLEKSLNDIQMLHDHSSKKTLQMIAAFIGKRRS